MRNALDSLEYLENNHIDFIALTERMDTTTPMGKCMYHVCNAFSAMERDVRSERTKSGMEAARRRGKQLGRPNSFPAKISSMRDCYLILILKKHSLLSHIYFLLVYER